TSTSTATGRSICGIGVTNTVTSTCPLLTTPRVMVSVACPLGPLVPGSLATFAGSVQNIGDVILTNVVVVSDRPAPNTSVFTTPTLAPGASTNFTGSYVVPLNGCSLTTTFVRTANSLCTGIAVTNIQSTQCELSVTPAISVTETCPPGPVSSGSTINYSGSVSNSGNITLTNVLVFSGQAGNTLLVGSLTLAPQSATNFTGSYVALGGSN